MRLEVSGRHDLDPAALRARLEARVAHYAQKYPQFALAQHYRWDDDTHATAEYRGGRAAIALLATELTVALELPFFARLYKAKIEDFLRQEIAAVTTG